MENNIVNNNENSENLNNDLKTIENNSNTPNEVEKKTWTKEEVEKLVQQESDRRVTSALKKAQKAHEAQLNELEKTRDMNAQERKEYELEQREKALADKEKAIALLENKTKAVIALTSKGLSSSLADLIVCEDENQMNSNIDQLCKTFNEMVKKEVESRLSSQPLKKTSDSTLQVDINKMSYEELIKLKKENPGLFNSLKTMK